jgi:hypothetical protein
VHLVFDIFQGMGVAAAIGIRPFLPAVVTAALAAGSVEIHFNHTSYDFLQQSWFLLVLVLLVIALAFVERRVPEEQLARGPAAAAIAVVSLVLGALFFAGSLARGHYAAWPGLIGGVVCAAIAIAATRPLYVRVRQRLDPEAEAAVPLFFEAAAVLTAVLSVVAPPIGLIAVVLLVWLLVAGRGQSDQKYAGLRILR